MAIADESALRELRQAREKARFAEAFLGSPARQTMQQIASAGVFDALAKKANEIDAVNRVVRQAIPEYPFRPRFPEALFSKGLVSISFAGLVDDRFTQQFAGLSRWVVDAMGPYQQMTEQCARIVSGLRSQLIDSGVIDTLVGVQARVTEMARGLDVGRSLALSWHGVFGSTLAGWEAQVEARNWSQSGWRAGAICATEGVRLTSLFSPAVEPDDVLDVDVEHAGFERFDGDLTSLRGTLRMSYPSLVERLDGAVARIREDGADAPRQAATSLVELLNDVLRVCAPVDAVDTWLRAGNSKADSWRDNARRKVTWESRVRYAARGHSNPAVAAFYADGFVGARAALEEEKHAGDRRSVAGVSSMLGWVTGLLGLLLDPNP